MAKVITRVRAAEVEAPATPFTPTDQHRTSARKRGSDVDVLMTLLRSAIADVITLTNTILSSAPADNLNKRTLEQKLMLFKGELALFSS
jgi:hypothetical protein